MFHFYRAIFGNQLDLHSGGDDLKFPHHENEIAQSQACFCSSQWTNYWLHTGKEVTVTKHCRCCGAGSLRYRHLLYHTQPCH